MLQRPGEGPSQEGGKLPTLKNSWEESGPTGKKSLKTAAVHCTYIRSFELKMERLGSSLCLPLYPGSSGRSETQASSSNLDSTAKQPLSHLHQQDSAQPPPFSLSRGGSGGARPVGTKGTLGLRFVSMGPRTGHGIMDVAVQVCKAPPPPLACSPILVITTLKHSVPALPSWPLVAAI